MSITFRRPTDMEELLDEIADSAERNYFLAGGTDINVQLKNGLIQNGNIFYTGHLEELHGIEEKGDTLRIGANVTFGEILTNVLVEKYLPFLQRSLKHFASPIIQNSATIGGNIANGSPTNDASPPLLVLNADLELTSIKETRRIPLRDFYLGYKKFEMRKNEIIRSVNIHTSAEAGFTTFYRKVAARNALSISKLSVAGLKRVKNNLIEEIRMAAGSLNEYPRRLALLEDYLTGRRADDLETGDITKILRREITPISDIRSDSEYRFQVCRNLVLRFISTAS